VGEGVSPSPLGVGSVEGAVPPPQKIFGLFISKKRYLVHSEMFLNFTFQSLRASFVTVRATRYMA